MKKPTLIDVVGGLVTAVIAVSITVNLAQHDVGVLTILSVLLAMVSTGLTVTGQVARAATTEVYRCSVKDCSVEIRATSNHAPERLAVLRAMATDHDRHGSAAV